MPKSFLPLVRVLFAVPPVAPFVEASGIGQGYHGPETGGRAQESNPQPTKKSCCEVRGSNPGPTKKIVQQGQGIKPCTFKNDPATRSGDQTLDLQKHYADKEHKSMCRMHE